MRGKTPWKLAVGMTALALIAAGCSSDDGGGDTAAPTGGELRVYSGEPESLLPPNTNESEGTAVLRAVYDMLVDYDPETGKPEMKVAESIESTDQKVWTIKIKNTYKFHNGEPVNADAFIRAWNYAAYGPNAQGNSYFMDRIVGYADLQSTDPDGEGPKKAPDPKAKELTGLKKVDDYTLEVTLTDPFASFPTMLGYNAFAPMAEACVADAKACEETPIGNGPFKFDGKWEHDVQIKLVRNDDYPGEKAKVDRVTFKIYAELETGYADFQAGNLDILDTVPPEKYTEAKQQYGEQLFEQPSSSFTYVGLPIKLPAYADKRVRQALSLAIDRQSIIDAVFSGRFTAAKSVVSPLVPGSRENACTFCEYDAAKAKELMQQAGGWKGGKVQLWFNAGAGHDKWMQAVGNQLKTNLGIEYELKGDLQFAEYLGVADEKKFTGPFRLGWSMDYPSPENYLKPLYGTQGTSNNTGYSNPEFDSLVLKGDNAKSVDEAITFYNQAEDLILDELPVIPMWFGKTSVLKGEKIDIVYNQVNELEWETATIGA
jgi:peptide/nickel transport system substrate-binding protein